MSNRTVSMDRIFGVDCPGPCDDDCEAGRFHCEELHLVSFKRAHDPDKCPALYRCDPPPG